MKTLIFLWCFSSRESQGALLNYKYECSLSNIPDGLHTQNPVTDDQNLPLPCQATDYETLL
jgi:hypothetical protein